MFSFLSLLALARPGPRLSLPSRPPVRLSAPSPCPSPAPCSIRPTSMSRTATGPNGTTQLPWITSFCCVFHRFPSSGKHSCFLFFLCLILILLRVHYSPSPSLTSFIPHPPNTTSHTHCIFIYNTLHGISFLNGCLVSVLTMQAGDDNVQALMSEVFQCLLDDAVCKFFSFDFVLYFASCSHARLVLSLISNVRHVVQGLTAIVLR